jgi:hydrogenase maturation protease
MQPDVVLSLVGVLGADPGRVLLVGCEPATLDHRMSLSEPVAKAVGTAVTAVLDLITQLDAQEELTCASAFPEK